MTIPRLHSPAPHLPALREFSYWVARYRRTWRGSIVMSIANPLLFILAMGAGLGKLVDAHNSAYLHGMPYIKFMAPGLVAAAAMQIGYLETAGPVLQSARPGGNYRSAVAAPMRPGDILLGHLLFIAFRILISASGVVLVVVACGVLRIGPGLLLIPAALVTGLAFAVPMAAFAVLATRPASISALFRFVIMPLYMFSGTFYPTAQLPVWLRDIVVISPLWHGVQLCRSLALGTEPAGGVTAHLSVLIVMILGGTFAARHAYIRRLAA
jgi:lipooligosaccharide transport system permease protein